MPAHKALPIQLSPEQECELKTLVRAHSTPQKLAERARIILLAATGLGVDETARQLGIWRKTAGHWRRRWRDADASASVAARLSDAPRCGAPATFTPEAICRDRDRAPCRGVRACGFITLSGGLAGSVRPPSRAG